jgi:hypothetical protein
MFHPHFTLRFVPDLAFEERSLDYQAVGSASYPIVRQRIASTLIDLPLNIKAMTTRFNNFALYMVSGGRYSTFLTRGTPAASPALKRYDIAAEAGMGIDLFMIYFKCAVELKFIKGLSDMTIYNGGPSTSLRSVKSQCLVLSLNFEG